MNYGLTIQPFMVTLSNIEGDRQYALVIDNNYYLFNNFVSCLDKTFKTFYALGLKYPVESKSVWLFLQKYFFEIEIDKADLNSNLITLLNVCIKE